ncbi:MULTISPECIES: hypothetical protein [Streptomyces]|uniref:hypothetical protein n=1 Tax=Streptomyces TaxID=1883 RepID=UPI0024A542EF|nr:hypothetical protein [Streptomyces sp. NBRC 13847]GLW17177.1 hypothetical protein Stsp01_39200 [Streptomyces sp. NBRC 13847]
MPNREITLTPGAAPQEALGVARAALERHGYHWVPQTNSSAEVREGESEVRHKHFTGRLAMSLSVQDDRLVMEATTNGLGLIATGVPAAQVRIRNKLNHCADMVDSALSQAGLTR